MEILGVSLTRAPIGVHPGQRIKEFVLLSSITKTILHLRDVPGTC